MIQYNRRQSILKLLEQNGSATVRQIAQAIYTSEASVRRDLEALEVDGYVRRVYGGAVLAKADNHITPVGLRDADNAAEKNLIAKRAAEMIPDGSTIILDASSTTRRILKYLDSKHGLRIFTNNLRIFEEIGSLDAQVYCTGGCYNRQNHAFVGPAAERFIGSVCADILFFSSQAISLDGEISDVSEEETALRRVMLSRAKKKVFLCDGSKIGASRDFTLCTKDDVDVILCNVPLPWEREQTV